MLKNDTFFPAKCLDTWFLSNHHCLQTLRDNLKQKCEGLFTTINVKGLRVQTNNVKGLRVQTINVKGLHVQTNNVKGLHIQTNYKYS